MEEEYSVSDPTLLLISASDFAFHPGFQSDSSTKEFLDRFPLPVIINALQTKGDVPGLENALVACLERIFKTKYGASLIPQYMAKANQTKSSLKSYQTRLATCSGGATWRPGGSHAPPPGFGFTIFFSFFLSSRNRLRWRRLRGKSAILPF
ncbi:uncharacterized protein LOC114276603 isoform X1 [Camellia sinensis]|uniref:uncharacterized protein LOC114276603 isoform X1 n=1 Tax=Camellia sinensis TaxID=4442 RepID=UPI001035FFE1|nr:uncharacterized protein LOC114276603 isoform X1 [Camellia sinensis]